MNGCIHKTMIFHSLNFLYQYRIHFHNRICNAIEYVYFLDILDLELLIYQNAILLNQFCYALLQIFYTAQFYNTRTTMILLFLKSLRGHLFHCHIRTYNDKLSLDFLCDNYIDTKQSIFQKFYPLNHSCIHIHLFL